MNNKKFVFSDTGNYWIGATEDPANKTLWYWVDGTQMTNETGWMFWAKKNPSKNSESVYLQIRTQHGDVVFNDKIANKTAGVLCERSP